MNTICFFKEIQKNHVWNKDHLLRPEKIVKTLDIYLSQTRKTAFRVKLKP